MSDWIDMTIEELKERLGLIELEQKQDRNYDNINELRRQIAVNDDQIETLEKRFGVDKFETNDVQTYIWNKSNIEINKKEISELNKKHRESEFLQIEINKEFEDKITELKEQKEENWTFICNHMNLIKDNIERIGKVINGNREVLRDFFEAFDKKHGSHFLKKLDGDQMSKAEKTIFDEVVRKVEGETSVSKNHETEIVMREYPDRFKKEGEKEVWCKGHKPDSQPETCPICDGTGVNIHREREHHWAAWKEVSYPCQCQKEEFKRK